MKALSMIGIIILFISFSFPFLNEQKFGENQTNTSVETLHPQIIEAFDSAEDKFLKKVVPDEVVDGPHPDVAKCSCKGTGVITHGDGHTTPCPYHAKKAEPVVKKPEPIVSRQDRPLNTIQATHYQVIIFTAEWCTPCVKYKKEVYDYFKDSDIKVNTSTTADIRIVDVDKNKSFYNQIRGNNNTIPLTVEVENNVVKTVISGYQPVTDFLKRYDVEK